MEDDQTRSSLLLRVANPDDKQSWGEFYEIYHPILIRYVRSRGIGESDAEDIVQDIFVGKLRGAMGNFQLDRQRGRFRTWLFEVTMNAIRDWGRRRQNQPRVAAGSEDFTGPISPSVTEELSRQWNAFHRAQVVQFALKKSREFFEPVTWQCFEQRTLMERSGSDVARELGLSVSAVYTNAHRVLEKVRELCRELDEELNASGAVGSQENS
jgi:RNA polymerase sigma factor (sigma-70 family)